MGDSFEFQQDFPEIFDSSFFTYEDAFFLVEFQAFIPVFVIKPDASISVHDPVEGDCFLAIFVGFAENAGNALGCHTSAASRACDPPIRRHPPLGN